MWILFFINIGFIILTIMVIYGFFKMLVVIDDKLHKRKVKRKMNHALWLCPICGTWQENPAYHLRDEHNVPEHLIKWFIEHGTWL